MTVSIIGDKEGNVIDCSDEFMQKCSGSINLTGKGNELIVATPRYIGNVDINFRGNGRIIIGADLFAYNLIIHAAAPGSTIRIGKNNLFNGTIRFLAQEAAIIQMGDDCLTASEVEISCGDFHGIFDVATGERINPPANILIEDHVWIGSRVTILKGTHLGRDSVVGLGSVVTGKHPAAVIVAGVPAKVIRQGIRWTI